MKTFKFQMILIITMTFGLVEISNAQKQSSGLYLTYNDYLNHKLSYTTDASNQHRNRLFIHEFIGMNNVTVITNGKKTKIPKNQIFGYHDSYNNDYRFYENMAYQIIDTN